MANSIKSQIIQAIKNFDLQKLALLLDDDKPYMDVTKSLFLKTLAKQFQTAKKNGCNSFDDVFFGICGSCNKGCEGITPRSCAIASRSILFILQRLNAPFSLNTEKLQYYPTILFHLHNPKHCYKHNLEPYKPIQPQWDYCGHS